MPHIKSVDKTCSLVDKMWLRNGSEVGGQMWAEREGPFFFSAYLFPRNYEDTQLSNSLCTRNKKEKFGSRCGCVNIHNLPPGQLPASWDRYRGITSFKEAACV